MAVAAARRRLLYRPFTPKSLHPVLWLDASRITSIDPVAALCTAANSESLSVADNTALSMGAGATMALHAFVNLTTTPGAGAQFHIAGKWHSVTTSLQEYALVVDNTGGTITFQFKVRDTGDTVTTTVTATTFGAPSTATWYSLWCYYNGTALGISVNDGAVDTAAYSGGILDSTSQFRIGSTADGASFLDGAVQLLDIWKNTVPTAAQVTALRNSGNGVFFSALPASIQVGQVERWNLSEVSGTRAGSIGGYTLTDNNTVTAAAGVGTPGLPDGGVVSTWPDLSGYGNNATQATFANKPAFVWNVQNGKPVVRMDGVNDTFVAAVPASAQPVTLVKARKWTPLGPNVLQRDIIGSTNWLGHSGTAAGGSRALRLAASTQLAAPNGAGDDTTTHHLIVAIANGTASAIRVDGVERVVGDAGTTSFGTNWSASSDAPMAEDISVILYILRQLGKSRLYRLERYLNKHWRYY